MDDFVKEVITKMETCEKKEKRQFKDVYKRQAKHHQFQEIHAVQSLRLSAQRKGYFETGKYHYRQHQRRRGKIRRGFLGEIGTAFLLRPYRLHLVRSPGEREKRCV